MIDPSINNNSGSSFGEGTASGVTYLVLQSPDDTGWAPATPTGINQYPYPSDSLGLAQLGDPTNVYIGGEGNTSGASFDEAGLPIKSATFTGAASGENFFVDTYATGKLEGQIFDFDFGNAKKGSATLNLTVQNDTGDQAMTLRNFSTGSNPNPVGTLNFKAETTAYLNAATMVLTIDGLNALATVNLLPGNDALVLDDTAAQLATITTVDGSNDNADINLLGLMKNTSTGGPGSGLLPVTYANGGDGNADALKGGTAAAPSTITLGTGADQVAVGGGWWDITLPGADSTVVVNPASGDVDTITALGGDDTITVGKVGGGGGDAYIYTGGSFNLVQFDQSGVLPQLQSDDVINNTAGGEYNTVQVIAGGMEMFDNNWSQIRGYEDFWVASDVTNQIQLNYNANQDAQSVAGLGNATALVNDAPVVDGVLASTLAPTTGLDIVSGGGGSALSTTSVNVGAGFNSPLTFTVGLGGDLGGDYVTTHLASQHGSNPLTVLAQTNDFNVSFEVGADDHG